MRIVYLVSLLVGCSAGPDLSELSPFMTELTPVGYVDAVEKEATTDLRTRLTTLIPVIHVANVTVRTVATGLTEGLTRHHLLFTSFDGSQIPAILQVPDSPRGAILVIPGHTNDNDSGLHALVYGYDSIYVAAATQLALAGFTTLTFELRGFGLIRGTGHKNVAWNAIAAGTSYKAIVLQDAQYAMAFLRSISGVEPAVTGASLGGELAATLAAIDERIPAVAVSAFGGRVGIPPLASGKQPHYCHIIPGLYFKMERQELFKLIAPRPLAIFRESPLDDGFVESLTEAWGDAPLHAEFIGGAHRFFVDQTIQFFQSLAESPTARR